MKVTYEELIKVLSETDTNEINLYILTPVKLNKKGNPLKDSIVEKSTHGTFNFGLSYKDEVNESIKNSDSDKEYIGGKLPFGKWVEGAENKVIEYTKTDDEGNSVTNYYLRYYPKKDEEPDCVYFVNKNEASDEELETIKKFSTKKKSISKSQSELGIDVKNKVLPLIVNFDNIRFVFIKGIEYRFDDLM